MAKYQNFLLDEFLNRRMKKSRLAAYIAMKEYRELRKLAMEIEGVESSTNDKENNDYIIVKSGVLRKRGLRCLFCSPLTGR